jgi:hypothetical protein
MNESGLAKAATPGVETLNQLFGGGCWGAGSGVVLTTSCWGAAIADKAKRGQNDKGTSQAKQRVTHGNLAVRFVWFVFIASP